MKQFVLLFLLSLPVGILKAGISLEVGNGILVETSSGVCVEIDSTLTETGTGYFKGEITSGSRAGMTEFAGMMLSSGLTGTITRHTGSAYAGGNEEGTNFKRYYEIENSGSAFSTKMKIKYEAPGPHDERNGLFGPFFIYRYVSSAWSGYGDGVLASPDTAESVTIPLGSSDWVLSEGVRLAVKIFLEGAYIISSDSMRTTLSPDGSDIIPNTSPYSENERTIPAVPNNVTDWVLVELRTSVDGSVSGYRSCFLKSNGMLVSDNGDSLFIGVPVKPGDYWVVIRHRNHLAVETKTVRMGLTWGRTPRTYNFTTAATQFKGDEAALLETGVYGMYGGECNCSGTVTTSDKSTIVDHLNESIYLVGDTNFSGTVTTSDKALIVQNLNISTNVNN